jgi:hypothetical protein
VGKLPKKTVKLIRDCLYLRKRGFCFPEVFPEALSCYHTRLSP